MNITALKGNMADDCTTEVRCENRQKKKRNASLDNLDHVESIDVSKNLTYF